MMVISVSVKVNRTQELWPLSSSLNSLRHPLPPKETRWILENCKFNQPVALITAAMLDGIAAKLD